MLSITVMAMLIAFVAIVALLNGVIVWPQHVASVENAVTLQAFLGWINAPFAWLMGVPWQDCPRIGQVLGERIVTNEFVGYLNLSSYVKDESKRPRSALGHPGELCAVRLRQFLQHRDSDWGDRRARAKRRADLARLGFSR